MKMIEVLVLTLLIVSKVISPEKKWRIIPNSLYYLIFIVINLGWQVTYKEFWFWFWFWCKILLAVSQ